MDLGRYYRSCFIAVRGDLTLTFVVAVGGGEEKGSIATVSLAVGNDSDCGQIGDRRDYPCNVSTRVHGQLFGWLYCNMFLHIEMQIQRSDVL